MRETGVTAVFDRIAALVAQRTGIVTTRAQTDLEQAARQVMKLVGIRSVRDLANRLAGGALWDELLDRITIRETYFFRNQEHFDLVRNYVIPAILNERPHGSIRVWSAGCASGEEPYSLAILLHQMGLLENSSVLGSDVSQVAITTARIGRYRDWSFRAIEPSIVPLYFRQEQNERVVRDEIREHVKFSQLNLLDDGAASSWAALGSFDLIFCRNVLIYFDSKAIAKVEQRLFEALAPGGWLIGGPSDPLLGQHTPLEVQLVPQGICYRRRVQQETWTKTKSRSSPRPPPPIRLIEPPPMAAPVVERPEPKPPELDLLHARAATALQHADYARVIEIARQEPSDERLSALAVRATWNQTGAAAAEQLCAIALQRHPLSPELNYLRAVTLMEEKRLVEALSAVRRALYLDRSLTIAHFAHGAILERLHDLEGARRAYRNTFEACTKHLPDEALALGDGIVAQGLANAASHALSELAKRCPD